MLILVGLRLNDPVSNTAVKSSKTQGEGEENEMSPDTRKPVFGVCDSNRPAQLQKLARGLKFRI